jgi:hypothetical protein
MKGFLYRLHAMNTEWPDPADQQKAEIAGLIEDLVISLIQE